MFLLEKVRSKLNRLSFTTQIALVLLGLIVVGSLIALIFRENQKSIFEVEFPESYTQPLIVKSLGNVLSIKPVEAKEVRMVRVSKNAVRYINAYASTDVEQVLYPNKLKESLIFKGPGHPRRFAYILNINKYDFLKDKEGNIVIYPKNKKGNELSKLFTIPAPFMVDAEGERSKNNDLKIEIKNNLLIIEILDEEWLANHKYPIILDPTVEINILNLHSHPQQGENWIVEFVTQGKADLKIIPNDQSTIEDDEFVSLSCGNKKRNPQILAGDVIYFPNWQCNKVAKVVHYTLRAGKHTLRFEFGGQTAYAYNQSETMIYRSVGPGNTSALATGSSYGSLTISNTTATFANNLPDNIGVGDAIQYDSDGNGTIDAIAFIHGRTSATQYTVASASGGTPTAVSGDTDWSIFRAYTSLYYAERGIENTGIDTAVRDFDTWSGGRDIVTNNEIWNIALYGDGVDDAGDGIEIYGWTTGPSNYIRIYTPTSTTEVGVSQRHNGKWNTNKYILQATDPDNDVLAIVEEYVRIDGLQIFLSDSGSHEGIQIGSSISNTASEIHISNNIIKASLTGDGNNGIEISSGKIVKVWNNILYDWTTYGGIVTASYVDTA
ncbi:MAG: hypothetical protein ACTSR2_14965, partial [Candidatus Hodarchaeales archaeon]